MSAIWGVVDLNKHVLDEARCRIMEEVYRSKKIDRVDTFFLRDFYMGCGIQYVTKEAKEERLPYSDGNEKYLVADVILDNREQLKMGFHMLNEASLNGVDGSILFEAVSQDINRALDEMLGAYAFAYYDKSREEFYLASDVVGNRSVYYLYDNGRVYFSTLLDSIKAVVSIERETSSDATDLLKQALDINKNWFKNYFDMDDLRVVSEPTETPYRGIFRVEPGEIVTFTAEGFEKKAYWNPLKNRKTKRLASDAEYKELVCNTFKESVESLIRDGSETAILLSGGLDSNAVAAYAAPRLKALGRKLYSFTSVPDKKASRIPNNQYYVEDETEYIEELQKYHYNLEPDYIDASEGDLLAENRKLLEIFEIPFKTVLNMPWIYRAYKAAEDKGCGIILTGQYGNITISHGDFMVYFVTLFRQGKWLRLIKEVNIYSKKYRRSRKDIYKDILKAEKEVSFKYFSKYMYDKNALRQVGETEVKMSLDIGIIPRDPTRDKRIIELVLSLPVDQFVKQGVARRLVREYMKDVIPTKIVSDEFHRGRQGVGARRLMENSWEYIASELAGGFERVLKIFRKLEFTDIKTAKAKLEDKAKLFDPENEFEAVKLMYTGLTCEYLEKNYHE